MTMGASDQKLVGRGDEWSNVLPKATMQFRRRAWLTFQRALDPLAPPRRLPTRRPH